MRLLSRSAAVAGAFAQNTTLPASRVRIDLHGLWERRVNGQVFDAVAVPSSQRPMGFYELRRTIALPRPAPGQRAILHFDTVNYFSRVLLNDSPLGTMGPYVPYEFDITRSLRDGANTISVRIADLRPEPDGSGRHEIEFGVSPGWEAYSGIVRDVYVEFRPSTFIDNVRFAYTLAPSYAKASSHVRLFIDSLNGGSGSAEVLLRRGTATVGRASSNVQFQAGVSESELQFEIDNPVLWSPESPNLYSLTARLTTSAGEDEFSTRTGFRDIQIRGRSFEVNGNPTVLHGVCRHDMWKEQGFTLTSDQMLQDMQMIKMLGANFARLVHYPHHRRVVELADELGLFVTEEPGHWNVDFNKMPRERIDVSLRVLERTIRRDWNSPSVFAWLAGNECTVTVDYLREAKALCRRLDPIARPVSFAHIYNDSKNTFDSGGLDFYTRHMYDFDEKKFEKAPEYFGPGTPLVHTEWGWEDPGHGQIVYERSFDRLLDVVDAGKVAGHSFWSWQDVRQYTRVDWPTRNGVLLSGVVDEAREPREHLYTDLSRLFQRRRHEETPAATEPHRVPLRVPPWAPGARLQPVSLQQVADSQSAAWADLESRMAEYWSSSWIAEHQWERTGRRLRFWRAADLDVAGAVFQPASTDGFARPIVITPKAPEITIPLSLSCSALHILGNVTMPSGFPVQGKAGETVATYTLEFSSGARQELPLRNGIEITRSNLIHEATRIEPVATAAPQALVFMKDPVRERYQLLLFSIPVKGGRIERLHVKLNAAAQPLVLFAISAETA